MKLLLLASLLAITSFAQTDEEEIILRIAKDLLTPDFQSFYDNQIIPQLAKSRRRLTDLSNPMYLALQNMDGIKLFMQSHVFAVWDFMSLVTALQGHFTSIKVPWNPNSHTLAARFVNEIKLGEESDIIEEMVISHFEYYLEAMKDLGIEVDTVNNFVNDASLFGFEPAVKIHEDRLPAGVKEFMKTTFSFIQSSPHELISSFVFGRETLIPDMFTAALKSMESQDESISKLRIYMDRHIEVDGNVHGVLGIGLLKLVCGDDQTKWKESVAAGNRALNARKLFYESILHQYEINRSYKISMNMEPVKIEPVMMEHVDMVHVSSHDVLSSNATDEACFSSERQSSNNDTMILFLIIENTLMLIGGIGYVYGASTTDNFTTNITKTSNEKRNNFHTAGGAVVRTAGGADVRTADFGGDNLTDRFE